MGGMARDRVWADMYTVAQRMTAKYSLAVTAESRRRGFRRVQGLATTAPESFEPIRERRLLRRRWRQLQGVDVAAARVGTLLEGASGICSACAHQVAYHPGQIPVGACAMCIAAEDQGEIQAEEMCRLAYWPPSEASERSD
jgi:hypothetical protein